MPERLRWLSRRNVRFLSLDMAGWMFNRWFRSSMVREVRSPMAAGILPERFPEKMVRELMRLVVESYMTLYQSQQSGEGFHEARI